MLLLNGSKFYNVTAEKGQKKRGFFNVGTIGVSQKGSYFVLFSKI